MGVQNISLAFNAKKGVQIVKQPIETILEWTNKQKEIRSIIPIAENKLPCTSSSQSCIECDALFQNLENEVQLHFVFDGVGDDDCHSIYRMKGTKTELLFSQKYPNSLGLFILKTDFSGFLINEGEYKLMALAAFGRPIHCELMLSEMIKIEDQQITLNMDLFDFDKQPKKVFQTFCRRIWGTNSMGKHKISRRAGISSGS